MGISFVKLHLRVDFIFWRFLSEFMGDTLMLLLGQHRITET